MIDISNKINHLNWSTGIFDAIASEPIFNGKLCVLFQKDNKFYLRNVYGADDYLYNALAYVATLNEKNELLYEEIKEGTHCRCWRATVNIY